MTHLRRSTDSTKSSSTSRAIPHERRRHTTCVLLYVLTGGCVFLLAVNTLVHRETNVLPLPAKVHLLASSSTSTLPPPLQAECSCDTYEFPKRSRVDYETIYGPAWTKTRNYVLQHKLTFLSGTDLHFHKTLLQEIEEQGIPGMIYECGVAKAGSSLTLAALKHPDRCLHLFDTFDGIPPPSASSGGEGSKDGPDVQERYQQIQQNKIKCQQGRPDCDITYYGNMDDLLAYDRQHFVAAGYDPETHHVSFHKGLFDDTVWPPSRPSSSSERKSGRTATATGAIAYAHLDGDWYESTMHMLQRLSPHMYMGGYIVLDDVYTWSGAKNAFCDFFNLDYDWLVHQTVDKECWTTVTDGTTYRIALQIRAIAQVVSIPPATIHDGSDSGSSRLMPCRSKNSNV